MCRHRIFQAAPTHKVFCGPKICRFPKIEEDLVELVHQRHSQFLTVNVEPIQIKAQELVPEAGLPNDRFKAIRSWVHVHRYRRPYFIRATVNGHDAWKNARIVFSKTWTTVIYLTWKASATSLAVAVTRGDDALGAPAESESDSSEVDSEDDSTPATASGWARKPFKVPETQFKGGSPRRLTS
ncbi:hypothetical protein MRX96_027295 [Rhipicephalus microplus]